VLTVRFFSKTGESQENNQKIRKTLEDLGCDFVDYDDLLSQPLVFQGHEQSMISLFN
jgi:hypothetical protein